jgi:hypothetical protein
MTTDAPRDAADVGDGCAVVAACAAVLELIGEVDARPTGTAAVRAGGLLGRAAAVHLGVALASLRSGAPGAAGRGGRVEVCAGVLEWVSIAAKGRDIQLGTWAPGRVTRKTKTWLGTSWPVPVA